MSLLYHLIFVAICIFILIRTVLYALYEINTQNNKSGGIAVIAFSVLVVIFSIIVSWAGPF